MIAVPTPAKTETAQDAPGGWDPYEVWRTRVLLPRLEPRLIQAPDRVPQVGARTKR